MSVTVMAAVFRADIRPATYKLVALKLADCANDDGTRVFPALATVAAQAGVSVDTARRAIRAFITDGKFGFLRQIRRGGGGPGDTSEYAFDLAALAALPLAGAAVDAAEADGDESGDENGPADTSGVPDLSHQKGSPDKTGVPDLSRQKGLHGATLKPEKGSHGATLTDRLCTAEKGRKSGAKGSTGATQTINRTIPPLTPQPAGGRIDFVDFDEFEDAWPWQGQERRDHAAAAFAALDEDNRRAAVDHVGRYLADVKAGRGRRKKRLQAASYLKSHIWKNRKDPLRTERLIAVAVGTPAHAICDDRWREAHRGRSKFVYDSAYLGGGMRKVSAFPAGYATGTDGQPLPGEGTDWRAIEAGQEAAA